MQVDQSIIEFVAADFDVDPAEIRVSDRRLFGKCECALVSSPTGVIESISVATSSARGLYCGGESGQSFQWFLLDSDIDISDVRRFAEDFEKVIRPRQWRVLRTVKYAPTYRPPEFKVQSLTMF